MPFAIKQSGIIIRDHSLTTAQVVSELKSSSYKAEGNIVTRGQHLIRTAPEQKTTSWVRFHKETDIYLISSNPEIQHKGTFWWNFSANLCYYNIISLCCSYFLSLLIRQNSLIKECRISSLLSKCLKHQLLKNVLKINFRSETVQKFYKLATTQTNSLDPITLRKAKIVYNFWPFWVQ